MSEDGTGIDVDPGIKRESDNQGKAHGSGRRDDLLKAHS